MNMKVLIVFPNTANWAVISMSTPILAGIAKEKDWSVDYFDTFRYEQATDSTMEREKTGGVKPGLVKIQNVFFPMDQLVPDLQKTIDRVQPDIIAITALSHEFEFFMSFWHKIQKPPESLIIIGGIHATIKSEEVIKTGSFDLVCIGEGEWTFAEILDRCSKEGQRIDNIPSTLYLNRDTGEITRNQRRPSIGSGELWKVKNDYSMYDDVYYLAPFDGKIIRRFIFETARGCPYSCSYCGNTALKEINAGLGKHVMVRPMDSIFEQLKESVTNKKIDVFLFADECFLAKPTAWLEEFAERYREIALPFIIQTRPESISTRNIEILKSAGAPLFQVSLGVESGTERILFDICNRKSEVEMIRNAFAILHQQQVRNSAFFMVGFPTETRLEIFKTIELCRHIRPSFVSVSIYQPLPGQKLTSECIRKGYITGEEPLAIFTSSSVLKMPSIAPEEIANLRRTFALYYYLPKEYFPDIGKCERDQDNEELFGQLVNLRWKLADDPNYVPALYKAEDMIRWSRSV